jgi:tetratricopeptide (TPR) repeat protein
LAERGKLEIEKADEPGEPGRIKGWFQDPYDPSYQGRALYSMSDDERLDALFLDHPLSKIRSRLTQMQNTFASDPVDFTDSLQEPSTREAQGTERARYLLSPGTVVTLYLSVGMFDRAERQIEEWIEEVERTAGLNQLEVARPLVLLGLARDCQGKQVDAEPVLSRARTIFEATLGEDHPDTAQAVNNLARVYVSLGRHAEAEPLFLQALRVFEAKEGARE